jgi:hypothetical protein
MEPLKRKIDRALVSWKAIEEARKKQEAEVRRRDAPVEL